MAQVKEFTAKKALTLDCGHAVEKGETFQIASVYICKDEAQWPVIVPLASLRKKPKQA